ncbi:hypothetical protein CGRA01v4_04459 [Colletotrichum graminicola]|nr:hypothetical protein CGRA01v4_04459 [Colletotrichum graminicola]
MPIACQGKCRYTDRPAACSLTAVCQARAGSSDRSSGLTKIPSKAAFHACLERKKRRLAYAATETETRTQPSIESKASPCARGRPSLTIPRIVNYLARFRVGGAEVARMTKCMQSDEGPCCQSGCHLGGGHARDTAAICRSLNSRCALN